MEIIFFNNSNSHIIDTDIASEEQFDFGLHKVEAIREYQGKRDIYISIFVKQLAQFLENL